MNDNIFAMILSVAMAAKEGRYLGMEGGGRWWHITEYDQKVVIDVVSGTKAPSTINATPHADMDVYNSLTAFLMNSTAQEGYVREFSYYQAKDLVKEAVNDGRLLHTNGNQWVILHSNGRTVMSISLGVMAENVSVEISSNHGSWKYIKEMGSYRATISPETKKYMHF